MVATSFKLQKAFLSASVQTRRFVYTCILHTHSLVHTLCFYIINCPHCSIHEHYKIISSNTDVRIQQSPPLCGHHNTEWLFPCRIKKFPNSAVEYKIGQLFLRKSTDVKSYKELELHSLIYVSLYCTLYKVVSG